jgi:hypothetical protein
MTKVRDFVAALARAGKSCKEIKNTTDSAYGVKSLSISAIYKIIIKVKAGKNTDDQRPLNSKKTKRTLGVVAAVAADIKADPRATCRDLATAHGVSYGTMHNILHVELGLSKKSARWVLHWDNAPVHTAGVVKNWLAAKKIQLLPHPPYSPDLAPADFLLFRRVKEELAGLHLTQESLKTAWEGVTRTIAEDEFAAAFRRWYERSEKCVRIQGGYVEKS